MDNLSPETLSADVEGYATQAVRNARKQFGLDLDYSERSIQELERILDAIFKRRARFWGSKFLFDRSLQQHAHVWGAYLGEVMRKHIGGNWTIENTPSFGTICALKLGATMTTPLNKVYKRLTNGRSVSFYFHTIQTLYEKRHPPSSPS